MIWQRLLFGSLMILAVFGALALDATMSAPRAGSSATAASLTAASAASASQPTTAGLPITLLITAIIILATVEMGHLCKHAAMSTAMGTGEQTLGVGEPSVGDLPLATPRRHGPIVIWAAFVAVGLVFVPWIEMQARQERMVPLFGAVMQQMSPTVVWIACGVLGACLATLARQTTERALSNMAMTVFMFLYLGLLASFWVRIRCLSPGPIGALLLVYVIMTIKASDIGAFFTGRAIGRHKLAPWLSPGKTIEGAFGAIAGSVLVAVVGMAVWPKLVGIMTAMVGPSGLLGAGQLSAPFTLTQAAVFGALMAIAGHLGDLVESAFKRDMHIKDSGRLVPAFGGILDLIDSPLFAAPIAWLLLTLWSRF